MEIRGVIAEDRQQARRRRTAGNRVAFFRKRLASASRPSEQLRHVRDYLGAIGDDLPPAQLAEFVRALARLADEWAAK